jgi:hypothetical protein
MIERQGYFIIANGTGKVKSRKTDRPWGTGQTRFQRGKWKSRGPESRESTGPRICGRISICAKNSKSIASQQVMK